MIKPSNWKRESLVIWPKLEIEESRDDWRPKGFLLELDKARFDRGEEDKVSYPPKSERPASSVKNEFCPDRSSIAV